MVPQLYIAGLAIFCLVFPKHVLGDSGSGDESDSSSSSGSSSTSSSSSSSSRSDHTKYQAHNDVPPILNSATDIQEVTDKCVQCISEAAGGFNSIQPVTVTKSANFVDQEPGVGPLVITRPYWEDAGTPKVLKKDSSSFLDCANDMVCSSKAVKSYMARYPFDCDGDGIVNCTDYAAIHYRGPFACQSPLPVAYKQRFNKCWYGSTIQEPEKTESWFSRLFRRKTISTVGTVTKLYTSDLVEQTRNQSLTTDLSSTFVTNLSETTVETFTYTPERIFEDTTTIFPGEQVTQYNEVTDSPNVTGEYGVTDNLEVTTNMMTSDNGFTGITPQEITTEMGEVTKDEPGEVTTPVILETNITGIADRYAEETTYSPVAENVEIRTTQGNDWQTEVNTERPETNEPAFPVSHTEIYTPITPPLEFTTQEKEITEPNKVIVDQLSDYKQYEESSDGKFHGVNNTVGINNLSGIVRTTRKRFPILNVVDISDDCVHCICEAATDCMVEPFPIEAPYVGPFKLSKPYWKAAGSPSTGGNSSFVDCANDLNCSAQTVRNYMKRFQFDCNGDGVVNCSDYAAIHNNGPYACREPLPDDYLSRFLKCSAGLEELPATTNQSTQTTIQPKPKESSIKAWFSDVLESFKT